MHHHRAAHVPGLIAFAADGRYRGVGITRAGHCAAQREMCTVVHLVIAPRAILAEVRQRGVDQTFVTRH